MAKAGLALDWKTGARTRAGDGLWRLWCLLGVGFVTWVDSMVYLGVSDYGAKSKLP